jgi:hypothetical protein
LKFAFDVIRQPFGVCTNVAMRGAGAAEYGVPLIVCVVCET